MIEKFLENISAVCFCSLKSNSMAAENVLYFSIRCWSKWPCGFRVGKIFMPWSISVMVFKRQLLRKNTSDHFFPSKSFMVLLVDSDGLLFSTRCLVSLGRSQGVSNNIFMIFTFLAYFFYNCFIVTYFFPPLCLMLILCIECCGN